MALSGVPRRSSQMVAQTLAAKAFIFRICLETQRVPACHIAEPATKDHEVSDLGLEGLARRALIYSYP